MDVQTDLSMTHYPLPITHYPLPITHYLLLITYYLPIHLQSSQPYNQIKACIVFIKAIYTYENPLIKSVGGNQINFHI
ncbi:hypothetical protein [Mastigocoleus testarum]|uniref:hypothetical protein n=1 Tax=Mastigocoleus testarum TaxID=996925 RepID=UPI00092F064B|nr:hypothetical protein [Mastigocoleus testarum]